MKNLKTGDKIKIEHAGSIRTAKVVKNNPDEEEILLDLGWWIFKDLVAMEYSRYNFNYYELLNKKL